MPAQFAKDPKLVEKVQYNPERFMTEEQIKQQEEAKLKSETQEGLQIDVEGEASSTQASTITAQKDEESAAKGNGKNKNQGKGKNKGGKQQKNNKGGKGQKNQGGSQKQNNQGGGNKSNNNKKKKTEVEYDYDDCDFPLPYSEKRLIENWFVFDDSTVSPILPGKLQSQFGGSNQNAYILIYRQKKISENLVGEKRPSFPEYWHPFIQNLNELNEQQRTYFKELENQLDVIVQDQSLFKIDPECHFVQYVEDAKIEEQGYKIRLHFSDTLEQARGKVAEFLGNQEFNLFEVDRQKSGNCQFLLDWSKLDPSKTLAENKVTHLSTWMVVADPALSTQFSTHTGENVLPIKIKLRVYGDEVEIKLYNNELLDDFLSRVESITSIPKASLMLKIAEDTVIRRIDRQVRNVENPQIFNSLRDVKVNDGTVILVEMKDESQMANESDDIQEQLNSQMKTSNNDFLNLDDTPNIRTVIVNKQEDPEDFDRFQINIDWTLKQLHEFLVSQLKREEPQRMRNHTTCRLFVKEEMDTQLRNYPDFQEGGARVQVESGRYPTLQEIVIRVAVHQKEDDLRQFYFPANSSVKECKESIAKDFGVEANKHTLYRVDHLEEPAFPLRREKSEITNCHVASGDLLILKSDAVLSAEEKLTLHIHLTMTGQPEDSTYIEKLEVNREYSVRDLKEIVLSMPQLEFAKNYPIEQIRIREKQNNMFFGKIYRDMNKSLKSQQVSNNAQIVVQVLQEPEVLDQNTMILLVCRRNCETQTYGQKVEMLFKHKTNAPTMAELEESCRQFYSIQPSERVSIAKYFPHKFEWKWMDKDEEIVEKKKKGKETKIKGAEANLKNIPFFMKDGDIVGVRFESENFDGKDDFQTEEDKVLGEEFKVRKEQERVLREEEQKKAQGGAKKGGKRQEGGGIFIRLEEDYPVPSQQQQEQLDANTVKENDTQQEISNSIDTNADAEKQPDAETQQ